ncbi:alkanesulfonate monooxygenase SsuD/methylene tetrahydromethanopterin reductase-like flavin-dependent oxidoreductase (luciferase family) [Streptomyces ambofaciens]
MSDQLDQLAGFARQAEELGADSLWVGDRVM